MARSYDSRKTPGGPVYDEHDRRPLRGVKRILPGRVTPGDHVEVSREIERLWLEVQKRRRSSSRCCPGGLGPVRGVVGFEAYIRSFTSLLAWYRLGTGDTLPSPQVRGTNYNEIARDSSGNNKHLDLQVSAMSGTGDTVFPIGHTDADPEELGEFGDEASNFTYDQLIAREGNVLVDEGAYFVLDPAGPGPLYAPQVADGGYTALGFININLTAGTDPIYSPVYTSQAFGAFHDTNGWGLGVNQYTGQVIAKWGSGASVTTLTTPLRLFPGTWYFAAMVWDSDDDELRLYLNGVLVRKATGVTSPPSALGTFKIGNMQISGGAFIREGFFYGKIDEVAVFKAALTADEIATLYLASGSSDAIVPGTGIIGSDIPDQSLLPEKLVPGDDGTLLRSYKGHAEWGSLVHRSVALNNVASYTVLDTDDILVVDVLGAGTTINLPAAAANEHRVLTIKRDGAAGGVLTIDGSGAELVDGAATYAIDATHESVTLYCDGSVWRVVAFYDSGVAGLSSADVILKTIVDAKGDLILGTAADTVARKAVGSDDTVLVADAAQSTGVKWIQVGNAQVASAAAIAVSKLAAGAAGDILRTVSGVPVWDEMRAARAYQASAQSIPDVTHTALQFDTEERDDGGLFSGGANTKMTAPETGWYQVSCGAEFTPNATGVARIVTLTKNGAPGTGTRMASQRGVLDSTLSARVMLSTLVYLVATDYVEAYAYQDSGAALNTIVSATFQDNHLGMVRVA